MYIPKTMQKAIATNFYDKDVKKVSITKNVDSEGGLVWSSPNIIGTFKANANFSNFGKIQEQYGLDYNINLTLTTSTDTNINVNDCILYDSKYYTVKDVIKRDSHKLVIAVYQEW